ncbi:hypothetical protein BV20DRAFT_279788 [Pilatotrama ljubarskyi]|nr:hypothetical protein BV20DRAFT_279788 [Pilatotrama ljubarskyi]
MPAMEYADPHGLPRGRHSFGVCRVKTNGRTAPRVHIHKDDLGHRVLALPPMSARPPHVGRYTAGVGTGKVARVGGLEAGLEIVIECLECEGGEREGKDIRRDQNKDANGPTRRQAVPLGKRRLFGGYESMVARGLNWPFLVVGTLLQRQVGHGVVTPEDRKGTSTLYTGLREDAYADDSAAAVWADVEAAWGDGTPRTTYQSL